METGRSQQDTSAIVSALAQVIANPAAAESHHASLSSSASLSQSSLHDHQAPDAQGTATTLIALLSRIECLQFLYC